MIRLKNIQPGIVLVPRHRLRLLPGGVATVEASTPEIERAIASGLLVRLAEEPGAVPRSPEQEPEPPTEPAASSLADRPLSPDSPPEELLKLPQAEVIQRISLEEDPKRLRAILAIDKRPRVQDAVRRRLSEIESVAPR
jgi:hypothetical protein